MRTPRLAHGRTSSFRPLAPEPQASSRNSAPFLKAAPPVRSNNQRVRDSARSPAAFAGDYNGREFPQSVRRGPARDRSLPPGNCFSFWPPFEPSVFLTIFPLLMFDRRLTMVNWPLLIVNRLSTIQISFTSSFISPHGDDHAPGPTGMPSRLSPRPSRF